MEERGIRNNSVWVCMLTVQFSLMVDIRRVQAYFYIISQKCKMGNFSNPLLNPNAISQLSSNRLLSPETKDRFIVKEMMTHSSQQHHQFLIELSKFKQYQCPHVVRLVDSHTMQSNNLCSLITYVYAILEKPAYTFESYLGVLNSRRHMLCNKRILKILADVVRALVFLRQEGNEMERVREGDIFIEEDENGEVVAKVMNPYFREEGYEAEEGNSAIEDMGKLIKKYLRFELHSQDLIQTVTKMANGTIGLQQLQEKYASDGKKGKIGLKLTKGGNVNRYDRTSRAERESLTSFVSDGSSLMIEGGDASDLALKQFYENLDGQISNIEPHLPQALLTSRTMDELSISHQFPKKYVKSRAFKKTLQTLGSEGSEQKQNITRDQSWKQNMRVQPQHILLRSAKLVQSFIEE